MKKLFLYASLVCAAMSSCTKDYVVPEGELPEWLGESIYQELKNPKSLNGTFNTYLRLIDDLDYAEVLGKTGSKTIFPANDEAFAAFFAGGNNQFGKSSYEELTISEKAQLLYSSMLDNAVLIGNLSTQQNANKELVQGKIVKHPTNVSLLQSVSPLFSQNMPSNNKYFSYWKNQGKSINALYDDTEAPMVHFSGEYMLNNDMTVTGDDNDFFVLTGSNYNDGDAYVFNHRVVKSDVTCQNGYIHQLDGVLTNPGNMAQVLREGKDTRHISRMLDYFAVPVAMGNTFDAQYQEYASAFGTQDSVFAVRYLSKNSKGAKKFNSPVKGVVISDDKLLDFDPGWNYYQPTSTTSAQAEIAAFLAPSDEVLENYFSHDGAYIVKNLGVPGLSYAPADIKNTIDQHLDAIYNSDPTVFASMLNNIMKPYLTKTVPSKFATVQNDAFEFLNITKDNIYRTSDNKFDVQIANNGVIYKTSKFFAPELYNSVLGPASVYKDMRIMGKMLNDHQITPGTPSTLEADMYYYLLSMKSNYALFVPTDNDAFYYMDPASMNDTDGPKVLKFYWTDDTKESSFNVLVQRYLYNGGALEVDPTVGPVAIEKGFFNTQLSDMLNYHTVVLENSKQLNGNHYYLTKHGGAIYVEDGKGAIGSSVKGGMQKDGSMTAAKVTEVFGENSADAKITNGTVYRLDSPIQPTTNSVYTTLQNQGTTYQEFLEFCEKFNDEDILTFAGILLDTDTKASKDAKIKQWTIFGANNVMNMLGTYNYTVYAPQSLEAAYAAGLPRWSEVQDLFDTYSTSADDEPEKIEAQKKVKTMITKMHNFVLYHIQSNSVFNDVNTNAGSKYQTFYTNSLGIAATLSLSNSTIVDEANSGAKIVQGNMLARDLTFEEKSNGIDINNQSFKYNKIVSSSFVVVHGIDKPLCYNASGKY